MRFPGHRIIGIGFFTLALALTAATFASALAGAWDAPTPPDAATPARGDARGSDGFSVSARVNLALEAFGGQLAADPGVEQGVAAPVTGDVTPTRVSAGTPDADLPVDARLGVDADLALVNARAAEPTTQSWTTGTGVAAPGSQPLAGALASAAAVAAAGAGAAAWKWPTLKRWLLSVAWAPLYARIARHRVLENDVRGAVFKLVQSEPGITASEIAERTQVSWGTTVYHLEVLEQNHMIVSEKHGRYRRFFENGAGVERKAVGVLRNDTSAAIADAVAKSPGLTGRELARVAGLSPQALHWHTQRLARANVVRKERDGRVVRYYRA